LQAPTVRTLSLAFRQSSSLSIEFARELDRFAIRPNLFHPITGAIVGDLEDFVQ
jgi:hypothetical protein